MNITLHLKNRFFSGVHTFHIGLSILPFSSANRQRFIKGMMTAFIFMAGSLVCVSAQAAVPNTSSSTSASKTPYYTANEKSYYMAPDASSSGDGSLSRPFATFKEALSVLKPGDTLILKKGTYKLSDPVVIPESVSGTYSAPITITAEKKAGTLINAAGVEKAKTAIFLDNGSVIASPLSVNRLLNAIQKANIKADPNITNKIKVLDIPQYSDDDYKENDQDNDDYDNDEFD
jgi:hypothetical protein